MSRAKSDSSEEPRRSSRIKNLSGRDSQYIGKYSEEIPLLDLEDKTSCSAKCLQNFSKKKEKEKIKEKDQIAQVNRRMDISANKAFLSSFQPASEPAKRKRARKRNNSKFSPVTNAKKNSQMLFRSNTFENLSDTSIDETLFKVLPGEKKKQRSVYSDSESDGDKANCNQSAVHTEVSVDPAVEINLNNYNKETDYDTCDSQAEDPSSEGLKQVHIKETASVGTDINQARMMEPTRKVSESILKQKLPKESEPMLEILKRMETSIEGLRTELRDEKQATPINNRH